MRTCLIAIVAGLTLAGTAAGEPPRRMPARPAPTPRPADVVLAPADSAHSPAPETGQPGAPPAKRRVARITTCRCGDPPVGSDTQEQ